MSIQELMDIVYEKLAYHITYTIDKDGRIIKTEKNNNFNVGRFNTIIVILMAIGLFIMVFGLTSYELQKRAQDKIFLESFYVDQLCFESDTLSECYSVNHQKAIKIYVDERNNISTLFVSGE